MSLTKYLGLASCMAILAPSAVYAEAIAGANGASGIGLIPTASVLPRGIVTFDYSRAVPGHPKPEGYNYQVGAGLGEGLELNFRLATQSNRCNYFYGECPPDTIRDLSGSLKYTLPIRFLNPYRISTAIGAVDIGGAATNFRSYYFTSTKSFDLWSVTLGYASKKATYSNLDGAFGSLEVHPRDWMQVSLQTIGGRHTAHAVAITPVPFTPAQAYIGFNRSITESPTLPKQWTSFGLVVPMSTTSKSTTAESSRSERRVVAVSVNDVYKKLIQQGFYQPHIELKDQRVLKVTLNNTAYPRNVMDAAGVALGVLAGLPGNEVAEVDLVLQYRGLPLIRAVASPSCIRQWFADGEPCTDIVVTSTLAPDSRDDKPMPTRWWSGALRPELILTPAASYSIGTEVAAIDAQAAVVSNLVVPLWKGATFDVARIDPVNWDSREFEPGGFFARDRYQARVTRRMIHQVWAIPKINSLVRASVGRGFIAWKGAHLDTATFSNEGSHRVGMTMGSFEGPVPRDPLFNLPIFGAGPEKRTYFLPSYRYAWDASQRMTSEITAGRFWGQDEGIQISQRFWFGDANIAAYYRRTKMPQMEQPIAFAGLLFTFPLTPRSSTGWQWAGIRGPNNFAMNVESKVGDKDNLLTLGYGEIPRFGEGITQFANQDRNSTAYYRANLWRLRNAFRELTRDGD